MGEIAVRLVPVVSLMGFCAISLAYAMRSGKFLKSVLLGWLLLILWAVSLSTVVASWAVAQYPGAAIYYPGKGAIKVAFIFGALPWAILNAITIFAGAKVFAPAKRIPSAGQKTIAYNNYVSEPVNIKRASPKVIARDNLTIRTMTTDKAISQNEAVK